MKKTLIQTLIASALASIGMIAGATGLGPAGTSGVSSGTQITLSAGVGGGSSVAAIQNIQSAYSAPSSSSGGGVSILGQSGGAAEVSGGGTTSSLTQGAIVSNGAAGGVISGGGNSQVLQSQSNQYNATSTVKGTVAGSLALNSTSSLSAGDNGGGQIGGSAGGNYAVSANSTRTGIFSVTNTANTQALGSALTSAPLTTSWGNSAYGLTNNATVTGGATAQAGSITSTAPVTP